MSDSMNAEINQHQHGSIAFNGKWFVSRKASDRDVDNTHWFESQLLEDDHVYLHQDGVWRWSTEHNGQFTGYFDSRDAAEACLAQALKRETPDTSDAEE